MPIVETPLHGALFIYYGLVGNNNTPGSPVYRSDNPWQKAKAFLDQLSAPGNALAATLGITGVQGFEGTDRGGSIRLVVTNGAHPLPRVGQELVDRLAAAVGNTRPGDRFAAIVPNGPFLCEHAIEVT